MLYVRCIETKAREREREEISIGIHKFSSKQKNDRERRNARLVSGSLVKWSRAPCSYYSRTALAGRPQVRPRREARTAATGTECRAAGSTAGRRRESPAAGSRTAPKRAADSCRAPAARPAPQAATAGRRLR